MVQEIMQEVHDFAEVRMDNGSTLIRDNRVVLGYHGTSIDRANSIVASGCFTPSKNDYDWLGHGIYFWEHAPLRAWQWARNKHRERAAVVEATIALGLCLDFSDVRYTSVLKLAYDSLREAYIKTGKELPVNKNKARCLDCFVINYLTTYILPECETVRAPFLEGAPIYEGAMLMAQSHIQLVVRTPLSILSGPRLTSTEVAHGT
jgi:hypothetical protein